MAFGNGYTFTFALGICLVCSISLSAVSLGLKDQQDANVRRDLQKNILLSLGLPEKGEVSGKAIDELWKAQVEISAIAPSSGKALSVGEADLDKSGTLDFADFVMARVDAKMKAKKSGKIVKPSIVGLYTRKDNGTVALPMDGKGLWGPISGYVAFDPKFTTVKGATFFAPKETPGLGAEITATNFEVAFNDKKIVDGGKTRPIRVFKAAECDETTPYCVDGVAGATITSRGVDEMISASLALYEPYFKTVRK